MLNTTGRDVTPRNGLVLIRVPEETQQKTMAGLYVPEVAGQQFRECRIVAVGRGTPDTNFTDTSDLKAGQRVLASIGVKNPRDPIGTPMQYTAIPLSKNMGDGEHKGLFLLNQHDIFAILPEETIGDSDDADESNVPSSLILRDM